MLTSHCRSRVCDSEERDSLTHSGSDVDGRCNVTTFYVSRKNLNLWEEREREMEEQQIKNKSAQSEFLPQNVSFGCK